MRLTYSLFFFVGPVLSHFTIDGLDKASICAAAPCHAVYIEKGVWTVNQTVISGPGGGDGSGVSCCEYDQFRQAVDPPRCCYTASGSFVRGRWSCPTRGVPKPNDCDKPVVEDTRKQCFARKRYVATLCHHMSGLGAFYGRICPTGGLDLAAKGLELLVNHLNKKKFAVKEKSKTKLKQFKDDFFTIVGASLGLAVLAVEAPAVGTLGFAALAVYTSFCNIGTGLQIAGTACSALEARYNFANDCSKLKSRTLEYLPARAEVSTRQEDNPCTQLLANLPTAADCAISAAIECSTNSSDYLDGGLTQAEADELVAECVSIAPSLQALSKLCALRAGVEAIEPICTEGEYIAPEDLDSPDTNSTTTPPTMPTPTVSINITISHPFTNTTFTIPTTTSTVGGINGGKPAITISDKGSPSGGLKPAVTTTDRGSPSNGGRPTKTSVGDAVNSIIQFTGAGERSFETARWKVLGGDLGTGALGMLIMFVVFAL